jgi:hypothetical protein
LSFHTTISWKFYSPPPALPCPSLFAVVGRQGVGLCTAAPSALKNLYGCPEKLLWENLGGVAETKMPTCKVKDCKLNEMTAIRAQ